MRKTIKKSNNFIKGRYDLNVSEQRLLLLGIAQIKKEDLINDKKVYTINIKDIDEKFVKYNRSRLSEFCNTLMGKIVDLPTDKKNKFDKVGMVSNMVWDGDDGTIQIEFHSKLKPFLYELKGTFTTYHLEEVMSFKSKYSIRIYELLIQYKNSNHKSVEFELEELFQILDLSEGMKLMTNFKKKVLEIAKKEINENSNILINYKLIKQGRSFKKIKFNFEQNIQIIEQRKILELEGSTEYYQQQLKEILDWYNGDKDKNISKGIHISNDYLDYFFNSYFDKFFINKNFLIHNDIYRLNKIFEVKNEENGFKEYNIQLIQGERTFQQNTKEISPIGLYLWLKDKITEEDKPKENLFEYSNVEPEF